MNTIKEYLKKSQTLVYVNSRLKAISQEKHAINSLNYYQTEAEKKNIKVLKKNALASALKKRLNSQAIFPEPKPKGALRIFLAFPLSNWEYILPISLKPFGQVISFEWRSLGFDDFSKNQPEIRDTMNNKMLEELKTHHLENPIDCLVGYFSSKTVSQQTLKQISDMGIVIFNFSWDDKISFVENHADIASSIDLNLTNAPESCIKYMTEGGLSMFWPEAAHPKIHIPYDIPFEYDVSFVGQKYGWRPQLINYLKNKGINIAAFGKGWPDGAISDQDMVKLYSKSRINLGFAGVGHSKKIMCIKARDFEIPMSGGLYLTQHNPELGFIYDIGREILTYKNKEDCLKRILWVLANPDKAEEIRKATRIKALTEHTWEKRFSDLLKIASLLSED